MTVEHAHSTNGRVHMDQAQLEETTQPGAQPAPEQQQPRSGGRARILMPLLLVIVAVVMLRRLQSGNVV